MKKAILTFGLFSLMMILTSFTSPSEIGGQSVPGGKPLQFEIGGQKVPEDKNPLGIGGQSIPGSKKPLQFEIGGQSVPGSRTPLA